MKRIISLVIAVILCMTPVLAAGNIPEERQLPLLVDDAGLLSDSEYSALLGMLESISEARECEVAIITVSSTQGISAQDFADDVYDYYGYGYGENDDGMLLLLDMGERAWHITTYGYGTVALTDYGIQTIGNTIVPYLSDGDYYEAFRTYAKLCDEYIESARNGSPVDDYGDSARPSFLVALIVGLVIALIVTGTMRGQLKTVHSKGTAADYTVPGSLKITNQSDVYLYRNVTKTARPKESSGSSGGGGSSMHTSSSGRSHGGGGGHF